MNCPKCDNEITKVSDSRTALQVPWNLLLPKHTVINKNRTKRRTRWCPKCLNEFKTLEVIVSDIKAIRMKRDFL